MVHLHRLRASRRAGRGAGLARREQFEGDRARRAGAHQVSRVVQGDSHRPARRTRRGPDAGRGPRDVVVRDRAALHVAHH